LLVLRIIRTSHATPSQDEYVSRAEFDALKQALVKDTVSVLDLETKIVLSAEEISKSVVSVNVLKRQAMVRRSYSIFDQFFGNYPRYRDVKAVGTGVIVTKDGYIITNAHVVEKAIDITVVLNDGTHSEAKVVGVAEEHDIAVLKIKGDNFYAAKIADSDKLQIGRWAIALGNPYSFVIKDSKPTLSFGVISALNRNFSDPSTSDNKIYKRMIQTDAAINPGNSGGPLVDIQGQVIGINTFILSESGGSVGIGFAIPINRVKKVVYELVQFGKIRTIDYGFQIQSRSVSKENEASLIVVRMKKESACEKAGLKIGDTLTAINGVVIQDRADINLAVIDIFVGDNVVLDIERGGEKMQISYVIGEAE
jgi:serine protease Do